MHVNMVIQKKPAYRLSWMTEFRLFKIVCVGVEAGISFTHQFIDTLYKEHPGQWHTPL
jgi:hypothetical protein